MTYDPVGRLSAVIWPYANQAFTSTYDAASQRTRLKQPKRACSRTLYDAVGRITTMLDWEHYVTTQTYDAASRVTALLMGNGTLDLEHL